MARRPRCVAEARALPVGAGALHALKTDANQAKKAPVMRAPAKFLDDERPPDMEFQFCAGDESVLCDNGSSPEKHLPLDRGRCAPSCSAGRFREML